MGNEVVVAGADEARLPGALARLGAWGPTVVLMVDGQLRMPNAPLPEAWSDVRLRTPGGTVSVKKRPGGLAVVVFGNADAALEEAQRRVAAALSGR